MSDFGQGFWVVGRKNHRCEWCGEPIPKGEKHYNYRGMWENEWQNWRAHEECHDAMQYEDLQDGFSSYDNERPPRQDSVNGSLNPQTIGPHLQAAQVVS